jgi:uncharacterized repeat protein (TIGR01451 family)
MNRRTGHRFSFAFVLASALLASVLILMRGFDQPQLAAAQGTHRYVADTGTDTGNDCTASGSPCATLQHAIDVAAAGDVIQVTGGTYNTVNARGGLSQIAYVSQTLTLRGGYSADFSTWDPGAYASTLDSDDAGRGIYISGAISVTVEGFTIQDNSATGLGGSLIGDDAGGGIYVVDATATISGNVIRQNVGSSNSDGNGGGIYLLNSDSRVINNAITGNQASTGGGIWGSRGGGLCAEGGAPWVEGNVVTGNQAEPGTGLFAFGDGGGLAFIEGTPTVIGNDVRENRAVGSGDEGAAGGIELLGCPAFTLTNNIVAENVGGYYGGNGILIGDMSGQPSSGWLFHNTVASNKDSSGAAGIQVDAGVVGTRSTVTAVNTIIVDHDEGVIVAGSMNATVTLHLSRTMWGSGAWANDTNWAIYGDDPPTHTITSTAAFTGTPQFLSSSTGDYHIAATSDAVDAGVVTGVTSDIDGDARDAAPDVGADEVRAAALQMGKFADPAQVYPGGMVTYTIVVTGAGESGATGVIVTDTLPAEIRPLAAGSVSATCTLLDGGYGGQVGCDVGGLALGEAAVITLTAEVTTSEPTDPPETLTNYAEAASDEGTVSALADVTWLASPDCHARINGALPEYDTVQAAVDASGPGDVIWIAGTCLGTLERGGLRQQVYLDTDRTLRGGYRRDFSTWDPDTYTTTLDAEGTGRVVVVTATAEVTLEGLRLTGGDAVGLGGSDSGDVGGGLLAISSTVTLSHCQVVSNVASSLFSGLGGGIGVATSTLQLVDTLVEDNAGSTEFFGLGEGGGLYARAATVEMRDTRFEGNVSSLGLPGFGGGAALYDTTLDARNTLWLSNTTSSLLDWGVGGGLYVGGTRPFTLTNCVFRRNRTYDDLNPTGSAIFVDGASGVLLHPTIAENVGTTAITADYTATLAITNAIVYSQSVGVYATGRSSVAVDGVLWHRVTTPTVAVTATLGVSHALTGDPAFAADGYHLTARSAAIDGGVAAGVGLDLDGEVRTLSHLVDLGADEVGNRPSADAGSDQAIDAGALVQLDGSGSEDPDGDGLAYRWVQTAGPSVGGPWSVVSPTFTAPDTAGPLTLTLTVTDTGGLSDSDAVVIIVEMLEVYLPLVVR